MSFYQHHFCGADFWWFMKCEVVSPFKEILPYLAAAYGKSRFDFYMEHGNRKAFIEVKGVLWKMMV